MIRRKKKKYTPQKYNRNTPQRLKELYEEYLDELWRTIIRFRDKGIDQYRWLQHGELRDGGDAHHIERRTHRNTRWDTRNGILVGPGHLSSDVHEEPERFRHFLLTKWFKGGERERDELHARANMKFNGDYAAIELCLLQEIKQYITLPDDWNEKTHWQKKQWVKKKRRSYRGERDEVRVLSRI